MSKPVKVKDYTHPFPTWAELLSACWAEGMDEMDPEALGHQMAHCHEELARTFFPQEEEDRKFTRPSRGSQCPQMNYFGRVEGVELGEMPHGIQATFALGHFAHAIGYAALASALPSCFKLYSELKADVSNIMPSEGAQTGTIDLVIVTQDLEEAKRYLAPSVLEETPNCLGDFKTMTGFSWREHRKADFTVLGHDALGYKGQLCTYWGSNTVQELRDSHGEFAPILIGVNKESPHQGIAPRQIPLDVAQEALLRATKNFNNDQDVGPWLFNRFGKEVAFYCGAGGRRGYCPVYETCQARRKAEGATDG